jgi:hypothetical protein
MREPFESLGSLPRATRRLLATAFVLVAAILALYVAYTAVMPEAPDAAAGRTVRLRLGGERFVYASAREARAYEIAQLGGLYAGLAAFLLAVAAANRRMR